MNTEKIEINRSLSKKSLTIFEEKPILDKLRAFIARQHSVVKNYVGIEVMPQCYPEGGVILFKHDSGLWCVCQCSRWQNKECPNFYVELYDAADMLLSQLPRFESEWLQEYRK